MLDIIIGAINGSQFIDNPLEKAMSTFTDFFEDLFGYGEVFYLVPLIALTVAIWYKTDEPIVASMFMIGSGAILSTSTLFIGFTTLGTIFTIFASIGFVGLVIGLIMRKR